MKPQQRNAAAWMVLLGAFAFGVWLSLPAKESTPAPAVKEASRERVKTEALEAASKEPDADAALPPGLEKFAASVLGGNVRKGQATLSFKDEKAYRHFLARAASSGLKVLKRIDGLRTVLVGLDSLSGLAADMAAHPGDYAGVDANALVSLPVPPPASDLSPVPQVPVGNRLLEALGFTGDTSQWGKGITIAVLDTGVAADPTLAGRLRTLDIGMGTLGTGDGAGHGTAVAALAAGASADAQGIAPAANILSIKVTGEDGLSDQFTLAQAIVAAADSGARIINISMGASEAAGVLTSALDYAATRGIAVVASAGNDQSNQLTWPAADSRVISVGAVDGNGQQVYFSNTGEQLSLSAPGYGVQTAWLGGQRVYFSGTSASAPVVSGAIAAVLSQGAYYTPAQAAQVLQQHSSDAGMAGKDSYYGSGILNLGWTMNRTNPEWKDPAIVSAVQQMDSGKWDFTVQNRSSAGTGGLKLVLDGSFPSTQYIPWLGPGESYTVRLNTPQGSYASGAQVPTFNVNLVTPAGTKDAVPSNNQLNGLFSK